MYNPKTDHYPGEFGHALDEDREDPDTDEEMAGHVGHRCTDVLCLFIFAAALVPFGYVLNYVQENAVPERLYHGYDFLGNLCGVDPGVENSPYLYWCLKPNDPLSGLDLAHPVCRPDCPTGSDTVTNCFEGARSDPSAPITAVGSQNSISVQTEYTFAEVSDYPSSVFAHRYCYPNDETYKKQLVESLTSTWSSRIMTSVHSVVEGYLPLVIAAVIAFILSFAYLLILRVMAKCLVFACLAIIDIGSFSIGVYLISTYWTGGMDGVPTTGDGNWDLTIGIAVTILSVVCIIFTFCACNSIKTAIGCIEAASECMFAMPTLLLEPLVTLSVKASVSVFLLIGFLGLVSCGSMQKMSLQQFVATPGLDISGVMRSFTFTEDQIYYMLYYIFIVFWFLEIVTALSQFVLAYSVQLWYFTPYIGNHKDANCCPLCKGYRIGITFHLGTLAFGALIVAVTRLIRTVLGFVAKQMSDSGNAAGACIAKACMCCVWCFEKCIRFLNKNAYMDVAINSSDFCTAARRAFGVIFTNIAAIGVLNGATWVFMYGGIGAITAGSVWLIILICTNVQTFSDSTSDHFVEDPVITAILGGLISAGIALTFMNVFDTVSDTILYCFAMEKRRREKGTIDPQYQYAPATLSDLIGRTQYGGDVE